MQKLSEIKTGDGESIILNSKEADGVFRQPKCASSWNLCRDIMSSRCVDTVINGEKLGEIIGNYKYKVPPHDTRTLGEQIAGVLILSKDSWVKIVYVKETNV